MACVADEPSTACRKQTSWSRLWLFCAGFVVTVRNLPARLAATTIFLLPSSAIFIDV